MQFLKIFPVAFAAMAIASEAIAKPDLTTNIVHISLPRGCSKSNLAACALRVAGTTASCAAAGAELALNPAADLSCISSAASTAVKFSVCKRCIPHKFLVLDA
ncbi:hypothetical protein E4U53_004583 [Claviceps sorghi]|nr:hypothetical protein E4U53_004583 [Claviceps sorghi]